MAKARRDPIEPATHMTNADLKSRIQNPLEPTPHPPLITECCVVQLYSRTFVSEKPIPEHSCPSSDTNDAQMMQMVWKGIKVRRLDITTYNHNSNANANANHYYKSICPTSGSTSPSMTSTVSSMRRFPTDKLVKDLRPRALLGLGLTPTKSVAS